MPTAFEMMSQVGSALGRMGLRAEQQQSALQQQNTSKIAEGLLGTFQKEADAGNVEFFSDQKALQKSLKGFVGPMTFEALYPTWVTTAQANRNKLDTHAAIAAMSAKLGQTQQAGGTLAPNAVPALVEAGTKAGVSPKDLESYGLNIGPTKAQEAGAETTARKKAELAFAPQEAAAAGQKAGAETSARKRAELGFAGAEATAAGQKTGAEETARLAAQANDPLNKARLRAANALAAVREAEAAGGPDFKVKQARDIARARAEEVSKVKQEQPILTDIHNAYFSPKLEPLPANTSIGKALQSGAVIVPKADIPMLESARLVNDSLNIATKLVPKLLSKDEGIYAVQKNRGILAAKRLAGDPDAKQLEAIKTTHIIPFIRSMTNRLNQREIELAENSIPGSDDSQASAKRKIATLKAFVGRAIGSLASGVDMDAVLGYKDIEAAGRSPESVPLTTDESF